MPRPRPPEELFPVTYRLTRKQIRKVQELGGVTWLREAISSYQPRRVRRTVEAYRQRAERNKAIVTSTESTDVLAARYKLSRARVQQIIKEHRDA